MIPGHLANRQIGFDNHHEHGGRGPVDAYDEYSDGCGNYYSGNYSTPTTNRSIVRVDIDDTVKKVAPLVRHFRELSIYTFESYDRLLRRFCKTCGVPEYKKNNPIFEWNPLYIGSYVKDRGVYLCETERKRLVLKDLNDLRGFLALWYCYLRSRNASFSGVKEDRIIISKACLENQYATKVIKASEPHRILRLEERSFLEEVEL